jgi:hypothetical protein
MVYLIFLNSFLVDNFSAMTIRVPSDRTTFSRGEMRSAKGRAIHSIMRKAMYVSGVTPPTAPLTWFFDRLTSVLGTCHDIGNILDGTSDKLSELNVSIVDVAKKTGLTFRATIHKARYFPRAPLGARDMILPASATLTVSSCMRYEYESELTTSIHFRYR